ncbi:hypothetical protein HPB51_000927 [Rhipicephalus microplus]|uniref:ADAM10 cysteine-rich domain-containing protein n=1 Tax=Rhipicephalus microplus TaxID=6941 RepID=A0A9J6DKU6_RHIMP|nr:hypothetical protein HPB51_000927 [Rhipicephalus microplus]
MSLTPADPAAANHCYEARLRRRYEGCHESHRCHHCYERRRRQQGPEGAIASNSTGKFTSRLVASSFEWNHPPYDVPNLFAKPGTPCDNYNGYCDVFQKCREVDPSGPLATLRKLLLSTETIISLRRWIFDNWWGVLLLGLSVLVFLCVVVKFFGRKTDPVKSVAGSGSGSSAVPVACNPVVQPVVAASGGGGGPFRSSQAATKAVLASSAPGIVSTALGAHSAPATATTSNFVKTTLSLHPAARSYLSHAGNGWV